MEINISLHSARKNDTTVFPPMGNFLVNNYDLYVFWLSIHSILASAVTHFGINDQLSVLILQYNTAKA
jgi:hypothetical protein